MTLTTSNITKYRLGPPSNIILDANTATPVDLGSTIGGVVFTYKQTHFKAIADQVIGAVADWRVLEEGTVTLSMPEISVNRLMQAFGYATMATTALSGAAVAVPGAFVPVAVGAAGTTPYIYQLFSYNSNGDGVPTAGTTITLGNNNLTAVTAGTPAYNQIPLPSLPTGAVGFGLLRTQVGTAGPLNPATTSLGYAGPVFGSVAPGTFTLSGATSVAQGFTAAGGTAWVSDGTNNYPVKYGAATGSTLTGCTGTTPTLTATMTVTGYPLGLIARIQNPSAGQVFQDTGITTVTPYTASTTNPVYPNTDTGYVGGTITTPVHQLDLVIPKNVVGSTLNWRWTFWSVVADGQVAIDWKRDKNSELGITLTTLMNMAQPIGQNLFKCIEEY